MKAINVREAQPRLRELIAEACQGELIVLTDGEKQVALEPHVPLDLEKDSPELEAELLKAIDGPFSPSSAEEMKAIGMRVLGQKQEQLASGSSEPHSLLLISRSNSRGMLRR